MTLGLFSIQKLYIIQSNMKLSIVKKPHCFLFAMMLFLLSACSGNDIMDTYWRNDKTGEWLIGLTEDGVIYDCKVWGISKMDERDGTYTIQANYGVSSIDISIGSNQDGKRTITIGDKQYDCSLIDNGWYMPDYPEKDTCTTIVNNNYREGDSVTIIGWVRPLPAVVNWLKSKIDDNKKNSNEVSVSMMANILTDDNPSFTAPIVKATDGGREWWRNPTRRISFGLTY